MAHGVRAGRRRAGRDLRSVRLKRFRFRIYFGDLGDVIRVFAFAHGARRPGYWKRRVGR